MSQVRILSSRFKLTFFSSLLGQIHRLIFLWRIIPLGKIPIHLKIVQRDRLHTPYKSPMTVATQRLTFAEYLDYDDGTDNRYELVRGELVTMTPPSWCHFLIADYLVTIFKQEIAGQQTAWIALQG